MLYTYKREKTFTDSFFSACFASLNAATAVTFASMALGHFKTQVCVDFKDTSKWSSSSSFCLPTAHTIKYSQNFETFTSNNLDAGLSPPFLNFSAGVAGILSLYFAQQSYRHFKDVF